MIKCSAQCLELIKPTQAIADANTCAEYMILGKNRANTVVYACHLLRGGGCNANPRIFPDNLNAAYTIIHKLGLRVAGIAYILPLGEYFGYPLTDDRIRILSIDIVQHYCKVPGLVVYFLHRLCKKAVIVHSPDPIENIIHDVRIIKTKKQYGG